MKKICIVMILCLALIQVKAQNGVVFKVKYAPNRTYQTNVKVDAKFNVDLSGNQELIDKIKSQGITQPIAANLSISMSGITKTGSLAANKSFPVNLDYKIDDISASASGKQFPIPPKITEKDFKMAGRVTNGWQIALDSANGKAIADSSKQKMEQMMNMFQKQIQFPAKELKPGDTFTQGSPMTIPIKEGQNVVVNASVTYKLVSIADGKAYFDLTPTFSMNFQIKNMAVDLSGAGTGKMVYSIKDNFPISKDGTMDMKIKVTSAKLNVDGTATVSSKYTCVIN